MQTDRRLLELAAKAGGIKVDWRKSVRCFCYSRSPYDIAWNPLTDDGDALRLAVKLDIWLHPGAGAECVEVIGYDAFRLEPGRDRQAVIRRAIVRAAAEIGRSMQDGNS